MKIFKFEGFISLIILKRKPIRFIYSLTFMEHIHSDTVADPGREQCVEMLLYPFCR